MRVCCCCKKPIINLFIDQSCFSPFFSFHTIWSRYTGAAALLQTRGSIISEILSLVMPPATHGKSRNNRRMLCSQLLVTLNFSLIVIGQFLPKKKRKWIYLILLSLRICTPRHIKVFTILLIMKWYIDFQLYLSVHLFDVAVEDETVVVFLCGFEDDLLSRWACR